MRRRLLRALFLPAAVLLAAEVLYLLAANPYLNSRRILAIVNRNPGRFSMRWSAAWTPWPGAVRLRNVEMRGRSARVDWYAHLDSVAASYEVTPLFGRTVHLRSVSASGIDYRQRRRSGAGEPGAGPVSDLPPLPGLTSDAGAPAGRPGRLPGAGRAHRKPWTIVADDIDAGVAQIWIDRYRLAGPMNVRTSMDLVVRGALAFPRLRVRMPRGDLTTGDRAILGGLGLDVESSLAPFVPRDLTTRGFIGMLTGRFQVRSGSASLFFLETYFKKAPWLHFNGHSAVQADLRLDGGRLQPGSTLDSIPEAVDIDFLDRKLTGRGRISARVEEADGAPSSRLEVVLDEFALATLGEAEPFARGRGFKVIATSTSLDLRDPFASMEVTADLPEAVIPDISFYNRYIPSGSGLVIHGGTGRIRYHVEGRHAEKSLHGWIELAADDVRARFEKSEIRGDVSIHTVLKDVSPGAGRYDISGTTVELKSRQFPWTASLSFPKAGILYTEPMQGHADAVIRMTDTTPLVAMFEARRDVSHFVKRLMTIRDIRGRTTLGVNGRGCEITDLEITGRKFLALADLSLHRGGKDGILYLKLHIFSVGVAFDKGKKSLDLIRARKWFETERAKRRAGIAPGRGPRG